MITIEDYIQSKALLVNEFLDQYTARFQQVPSQLQESIRYSLLAGGKRIRPVLVLATMEACGGEEELALPYAAAIEMIHTYSLIHDDLPCMDDDDLRRGKPTNHKVFGENIAILAGDALLTEAFALLSSGKADPTTALTIIREGVHFAGAYGMVGGQVSDLESENKDLSVSELEQIHKRKTGDLIAYAVRTGGYLGQASSETMKTLTRFAYQIGLAFQIQDDILDVIGEEAKIGKPLGSDVNLHKTTYPAILGLEKAKQRLTIEINLAKSTLEHQTEISTDRLLEIADYLLTRDR